MKGSSFSLTMDSSLTVGRWWAVESGTYLEEISHVGNAFGDVSCPGFSLLWFGSTSCLLWSQWPLTHTPGIKTFFLNTNLETQSQEMTDQTLSTHKPKESILPSVISVAVVRAVNTVLSTATFHSIKRNEKTVISFSITCPVYYCHITNNRDGNNHIIMVLYWCIRLTRGEYSRNFLLLLSCLGPQLGMSLGGGQIYLKAVTPGPGT